MMKMLSSYIDKMLGALSDRFPSAVIRYAFMAEEELHVVDLTGNEIGSLAEADWANMYNEWVDDFERKFSGESLLLVHEGDYVRVSAEATTNCRAPKTLVDNLPNGGSIKYTWTDKFADYVYEAHDLLRILIPPPKEGGTSPRRASRKQNNQVGESTFTFDSVLTNAGTESFCM